MKFADTGRKTEVLYLKSDASDKNKETDSNHTKVLPFSSELYCNLLSCCNFDWYFDLLESLQTLEKFFYKFQT